MPVNEAHKEAKVFSSTRDLVSIEALTLPKERDLANGDSAYKMNKYSSHHLIGGPRL